jgi:hypothetical protein
MPDTTDPSDSNRKSPALVNFEANLDDIMAFLKQLEADKLHELTKSSTESVRHIVESIDATKLTDQLKSLKQQMGEVSEAIKQYVAFRQPALKMICVMLISYIEAYFEDVLTDLARRNPTLITDPAIDTKRLMEIDSIDELRLEVLVSWAKGQVRAGGPRKWCGKLRDMGAKSINKAAVDVIQELYDIRNLIVHDRATISHAHARTYSRSGVVAGTKINITHSHLAHWLSAIKKLVDGVEVFSRAYATAQR